MKKKTFIAMMSLVFVLAGCGNVAELKVDNSAESKVEKSESKSESATKDKEENNSESLSASETIEEQKEEQKEEAPEEKVIKIQEGYRVVKGVKQDYSPIEYDKNGNMIRNNNMYYEYDANGNQTRVVVENGDAVAESLYVYDEKGNVIKATTTSPRGTEEITYAYDADGNKIKEDEADKSYWEEWEYNDSGEVIKYVKYYKSDNTIMQLKEYNVYGELCNGYVRYSDGREYPSVVTECDEKGRCTKYSWYTEDNSGTYMGCKEYEYDDMDRVVRSKEYNQKDKLNVTMEYTYDEQGRLVREDCIRSNTTGYIEYSYEDNGNVTQAEYIMDILQNVQTTDSEGNVVKFVRYAGVDYFTEWTEYDSEGRLIKKYDEPLHRCEVQLNGKHMEEYQYDNEGKVVSAILYDQTKQTGRKEYEYNAAGNILKITTYDVDDNMVFWQDYSYDEYDNLVGVLNCDGNVEGEIPSKHVWTYTYH